LLSWLVLASLSFVHIAAANPGRAASGIDRTPPEIKVGVIDHFSGALDPHGGGGARHEGTALRLSARAQ
jgi:hypothetical protein